MVVMDAEQQMIPVRTLDAASSGARGVPALPATTVPESSEPAGLLAWARLRRRLIVRAISTVGLLWLILEISQYFHQLEWVSAYRFRGLLGLLGLAAFVVLVDLCIYLRQRGIELGTKVATLSSKLSVAATSLHIAEKQDVTAVIVAEMQRAFTDRRWEEVVRLGSALSRPLWITGRNTLRIQLGTLVESAASYSQNVRAQAAALIDDLGWTNASMGRHDEARRHIEHGIKLAKQIGDEYLVSKGNRHLSGIAMRETDLSRADSYLAEAKASLAAVSDARLKAELDANFLYVEGVLLRRKGAFEDSIAHLEEAQRRFTAMDDRDRAAKCFSAMGDAHLAARSIAAAKDSYRIGLAVARKLTRKDAELRCLLGLADTAAAEGVHHDARRFLDEARGVADEVGDDEVSLEIVRRGRGM